MQQAIQKYIIPAVVLIVLAVGGWLAVNAFFDRKMTGDVSVVEPVVEAEADMETQPTTSTNTEKIEQASSGEITNNEQEENHEESQIIFAHAQWAYDPRDTKTLIQNKENVILGRVIARKENYSVGDMAYPAFSVEVISNAKGNMEGNVTLVQGGIYYRGGHTFVVNGDIAWPTDVREKDILLQEGTVYLLAGTYSEERGTFGVGTPPYDHVLITTDMELSNEEAMNLAKQNSRVQDFVAAMRMLGDLDSGW